MPEKTNLVKLSTVHYVLAYDSVCWCITMIVFVDSGENGPFRIASSVKQLCFSDQYDRWLSKHTISCAGGAMTNVRRQTRD